MEMRLEEEYGVNPTGYSNEEMLYLFEQIEADIEALKARKRDLEMQIRTLKEYREVLRPDYEEVKEEEVEEELERITDESAYPDHPDN